MKKQSKNKNQDWWRYGLWLVLFLVLVTGFSSWLGVRFVCEEKAYLGCRFDQKEFQNPFWYSRANFDGFYYLSIARDGYGHLQEAFFPLYPRLIHLLTGLTNNFLTSGLLISLLSLLGAVYFLGKLMLVSGEKESVVKTTLTALLFFPTSFYFLSVYTESLFLFLTVLTFYFAKRNRWLEAGLIGALASYASIVGIFIFPALLIEYWAQRSRKERNRFRNSLISGIKKPTIFWQYLKKVERKYYHVKNTFYISLSTLGLIDYGRELSMKKNDFLYFAHVQPGFGDERQINELILPYQVMWRYLKMIFLVERNLLRYYTIWLEFLVALLVVVLLLLGLTRKNRLSRSLLTFGWLAFLLPTLTGTLLSMPRFALTIFPAFWVLGKILDRHERLARIYYFISISLLVVLSILYTRGYWVG